MATIGRTKSAAVLALVAATASAFAPLPAAVHQWEVSTCRSCLSASAFSPAALVQRSALTFRGRTVAKASIGIEDRDDGSNEEDDDEDEDDEDEDDDGDEYEPVSRRRRLKERGGSSLFAEENRGAASDFTLGKPLDPNDPNPVFRPRPGKYGFPAIKKYEEIPDEKLVQTMSNDERWENLMRMRQLKKTDLPDLRSNKDYAGVLDAQADYDRRDRADPWFKLNTRLREACKSGEEEEANYLRALIEKLGGPIPGIELEKDGWASPFKIFDIGMSERRAQNALDYALDENRRARGRAMAEQRRRNAIKEQQQYEEAMRNPGAREAREAKVRRERMWAKLMDYQAAEKKRKEEKVKKILGKLPDIDRSKAITPIEELLEGARKDFEADRELRRQKRYLLGTTADEDYENRWAQRLERGGSLDDDDYDDDDDYGDDEMGRRLKTRRVGNSAEKARAAAAAADRNAGGRPRIVGDKDMTRGEISPGVEILPSSSCKTNDVTVEITSTYNAEQSDPPMRKHCFQYTIRIANSGQKTIQLVGRKFEIQTVGSSLKDVVVGEGVTGRKPLVKPGEVFNYTSTAPLSVRPVGTTVVAARMSGEYRYVTLEDAQETATEEQLEKEVEAAQLETFHFIFPEEQRVKPPLATDDDEDDDDDDDDEDEDETIQDADVMSKTTTSSPASTAGDADIERGEVVPLVGKIEDNSNTVTDEVRVVAQSSYKPDRSDPSVDRYCFSYSIRITNESAHRSIQLVSRRFEVQTIGNSQKDVVTGPGVTGRQPILKPGESFEYTSTAPLTVKPMLDKTPVMARMSGEYNFVPLEGDGGAASDAATASPSKAVLGTFHFFLPESEM